VMVPRAGLRAHDTKVPDERFATESCWVPEDPRVAVDGVTLVSSVEELASGGGVALDDVETGLPKGEEIWAIVLISGEMHGPS
jgi:hypothetical protein